MSASRFGSPRTSRAGTRIGSKEVELTSRRSGRRSTTNRLTNQSPSAVSESSEISFTGNAVRSFRVGRSVTIADVLRAWSCLANVWHQPRRNPRPLAPSAACQVRQHDCIRQPRLTHLGSLPPHTAVGSA